MNENRKMCKENFDFQAFLEQRLMLPERIRVEKHLKDCPLCAKDFESYRRLFTDLDTVCSPGKADEPSAAQIEKVFHRLQTRPPSPSSSSFSLNNFLEYLNVPAVLTSLTIILLSTIVIMQMTAKTQVKISTSPSPAKEISPFYTYLLNAPDKLTLSCIENPSEHLPPAGPLEIGSSYRVPHGGKLVVSFLERNFLEFTQQAHFQATASGVSLISGKLVCDLEPRGKPYLVTTPLGTVTSLGTRFSVEVSPLSVKVSLDRGKIKIQTRNSEEILYDRGTVIINLDGSLKKTTENQTTAPQPPFSSPVERDPSAQIHPTKGDPPSGSSAESLSHGY